MGYLISLLLGIALAVFVPQIRELMGCLIALAIVTGLTIFIHQCRYYLSLLLCVAAGATWATIYLNDINTWTLPHRFINQPVLITGIIASVPKQTPLAQQFNFQLEKFNHQPTDTLIKLSWYKHPKILHVGERWQFYVKLKPPHAMNNPGGFNFKRWLLLNHLHATGYIDNHHAYQYRGQTNQYFINQVRERIVHFIQQALPNDPLAGILIALAVGLKTHLTQSQWQIFRNTGTSHLVAISGLHIGMVAGVIFFLVGQLWRRIPLAPLYISTPKISAFVGLMAAVIYALLSGLNPPAQRSMIMLALVLMGQFSARAPPLSYRLLLALVIIAMINPLDLTSASCLLSFAAVGALSYAVSGRLYLTKWQSTWRLQLAVTLLLLPITLGFFNQTSLSGLFINFIAIPWIGMVIVPLVLLACCCLFIHLTLASDLFKLAAFVLKPLWLLMQKVAMQPWGVWQHAIANPYVVALALMGIVVLLLPNGFYARYLGIILLLPLFFWHPPVPPKNAIWMTLLNVGQGLSVVIRTHRHVLIYDTGPKSPNGFDAGREIVLPYLHLLHIKKIDRLVVSHGDNDHIGGAPAIIHALPVKKILTSVPKRLPNAHSCYQGQHWQWDGVRFQMLFPLKHQPYRDNNSSCVLKISVGRQAILLVGDIERAAEQALIDSVGKTTLNATVLVAPHHGSKTSSSAAFVAAVSPRYVLFPVGYYNRYHFPSKNVVARYRKIHARLYSTARDGAVEIKIKKRNSPACR